MVGFGHIIILAWNALLTFSQVLQISAKLSLSSLSVSLKLLRAQLTQLSLTTLSSNFTLCAQFFD